MNHPYDHLDGEKFWRVSVSEKGPGAPFLGIWAPKFEINRETKLISAGSCFAQHVGAWLLENGYAWLPSWLTADAAGFSFALGNIYTPAALVQWLWAALGEMDLAGSAHVEDDVHYDLLRPSVFPGGVASADAFQAARRAALAEMLSQIKQSDVFIFTLGLTEAWLDDNHLVYPVCPGTIAGRYDPARHRFKNFAYPEILEDVLEVRSLLHRVNPDLKIILTVSPVPLTATASREHVLVATTHSKAVLRAVAGHLNETLDDVDYFPSYELINAPGERERFFADNLRSVTRVGVDYVLEHFSAALQAAPAVSIEPMRPTRFVAGDAFCDEEQLDRGSSGTDGVTTGVLLLGDSHMGNLSEAFDAHGIAHAGGRTMDGTSWVEGRFARDDDHYLTLHDPIEAARWRTLMRAFADQAAPSGSSDRPIVFTNVGLHTHLSIDRCWSWIERNHDVQGAISHDHLVDFLTREFDPHLKLLEHLSKDFQVIVVTDPPLQALFELTRNHVHAFDWYESGYGKLATALGCTYFSARAWLGSSPETVEKYRRHIIDEVGNEDWFHGNELYYRDLARELAARFLGVERMP